MSVQADAKTGEIIRECSNCAELAAELERERMRLKGAERDLNTWRLRYEDLRRDKEAEAREHELWDPALDLFALWNRAAGEAEGKGKAKKCKFSPERFYLVLPFLKRDGLELCQAAIVGRTFDHYTDTRKNGSQVHYHEWERIFSDRGEFEDSCNRAPRDWRDRVQALSRGKR